ncbi:hypothetical protein [Halomonas denitrificans]|nr:hypothetical protein [Halomonas denitrificans]
MIVNRFARVSARISLQAAAVAALAASAALHAEVVEVDASGFVVEHTATAPGSPAETWTRLIEPAAWWHPDHTWSGDAANLRLEARAGGCFCETLDGGGSVEHLRVALAAPGRMLRMSGGLGPLQALPVDGVLTVSLADAEDGGTDLTLNYAVAGSELEDWAAAVDGVLGQQVQRLVSDEAVTGTD